MSYPPPADTPQPGQPPSPTPGMFHNLGLSPRPDVPPKVRQLMQAMWGIAATGAAFAVFSILAAVAVYWYPGAFIGPAVFALLTAAACGVIAVMLLNGAFSRMNLPDRRLVAFIVLGVTGFTTLTTLLLTWGPSWYVLLAILLLLAQATAIGFSFFLLTQGQVVGWLNAHPGPAAGPLGHPQPPQPPWTHQSEPGYPPQPPPGQNPQPGQNPPPPGENPPGQIPPPPPGQYPPSA
ncbi:hypothetical protein FB566_1211 [Stackebrandtia endophytica]|uniref:Uncharacterized protein n=1 Tax=Stackebrandtia endophytica TaxID=1496996 RepID=A0A543ASZ3_9ACTN|nr:hypothetical protein [Stackebrandtia endophytica]TQL75699.1 hypothetical protein FB566_1211 [Stackebrandtia endophytica]